MKKAGIIIFMFLSLSCSKETVFSYRLKGKWTIDQLDVTEKTNALSSSYTLHHAGNYDFTKNNEGTFVSSSDTSSKSISFKWSTESNTAVNFTFENKQTEKWNVITNESKKQIWENTITTEQSSGGVTATNTTYKKMYLQKLP